MKNNKKFDEVLIFTCKNTEKKCARFLIRKIVLQWNSVISVFARGSAPNFANFECDWLQLRANRDESLEIEDLAYDILVLLLLLEV